VKKIRLSLQLKFFLSIVLIVVPVLGIIFAWTSVQNEKQAMDQVLNQAKALANQVILARQWVTDCGGVLIPRESKGAKGIPLFYDDRLETSRGTYQRFTPAMVTKKLSQYSNSQDLYRFHLASLTPINPQNSPNEFEKEALKKFGEQGINEMISINQQGQKQYLQYMVPLHVKRGCLECHHESASSPNGIRGGLSVILPIDKMKSAIAKDNLKLAVAGFVLILMTILTLFFLLRRVVITPLKDLEEMTNEISKGNLEARVHIATGDEFEKLGTAFNTMGQKLTEGRDLFEDKIALATNELSEANRELQTLDKLKSDFLANMSHELRSPLTVIRGGIDYLNRTVKLEENRNYIRIMDKNLTRLINLVSDLFDFTKIEAQKIEWSFAQENLSVLIHEVVEIISPLAIDKKIAINFASQKDIFAEFDLERIEQVLVNLIDNAIKFSDPDTKISIQIEKSEDFVTVSVRDQGIGIREKNLETIFDKFSTVPSGRDGNTEGTGLGLAICKAIIEAHKGRIWAESDPGVSSTFCFTLPKKRT